jgi:hypothetical protein
LGGATVWITVLFLEVDEPQPSVVVERADVLHPPPGVHVRRA